MAIDSIKLTSGRTPKYCSRVLAVCPKGQIILIQKPQGHFELPGGSEEVVDKGNPANTALRKFGQETGIYLIGEPKITRLREMARVIRSENHIWVCYLLHITEEELHWHIIETHEGMVRRLNPEKVLSNGYLWWGLHQDQYDIIASYYMEGYS